MGYYRSSEIEITSTGDLSDYDAQVVEYMCPDTINDALELMERWGYKDEDIIEHILEYMESDLFLSKLADILTVKSALQLVNDLYDDAKNTSEAREANMMNVINELRKKIRELEKVDDNNTV